MERALGMLSNKKLSLMLDYDGTLTPIVGRPQDAALSFKMKELLRSLAARYPLAVITGRGLDDIKTLVGLRSITYAANHGLEVSSSNLIPAPFTMVFDPGRGTTDELKRLSAELEALGAACRGAVVEDKGATLSVHYRLVDSSVLEGFLGDVKAVLRAPQKNGLVRVTEGKKVIEVRPMVSWDKGSVVKWLIDRQGFASTFPVYMGDDATDFDAFSALRGVGLSVFVGALACATEDPLDRGADCLLGSQNEVYGFLKRLYELKDRAP